MLLIYLFDTIDVDLSGSLVENDPLHCIPPNSYPFFLIKFNNFREALVMSVVFHALELLPHLLLLYALHFL